MSEFVDLQVNGFGGVDFNTDSLTDEDASLVCRKLATDGVITALATIITADFPRMIKRISRIAELIEQSPEFASIIGGIHVEGPFLNPKTGFVGAHPVHAVQPATVDQAKKLLDAGRGHVKLVTLAPEMDADHVTTRWLADQGIIVAAGHCDSTVDQLNKSIDNGLKLFTHLGNACPQQMHRHDNIIWRVLSASDQISISLIADGHHLPAPILKTLLKLIPDDNIIVVSDAISAAGLGPGRYELADQIVEVDEDGAAWGEGRKHFAGCATPMSKMVDVLRDQVGIQPKQSRKWMCDNPSRLLTEFSH